MVKIFDRFEAARLAASSCLLRLPFSAASIRPTIQLLLNSINREEQNGLGSHAGLHHRYRRSRAAVAERISGCGEPVWSKISNELKRLGFRSHSFLAQLLSETSRACTIRVRRSSLGRLWHDLGSHAGLHHRKAHYHEERNHQGKQNRLLFTLPNRGASGKNGIVRCK